MFAYCGNDSVNRVDYNGDISIGVIVASIVGIFAITTIPSDVDQTPKYKKAAQKKYNKNTINMTDDKNNIVSGKLNVIFYPEAQLIHIEDSYSINDGFEKEVIIDEIMKSNYYNPHIYGNSKSTMMIEWSAHNFVYHTASSSNLAYAFFRSRGYENPIESTRGVDFRKQLEPSVERNYNLVTFWGLLQW